MRRHRWWEKDPLDLWWIVPVSIPAIVALVTVYMVVTRGG
jgi:hypothetical protein